MRPLDNAYSPATHAALAQMLTALTGDEMLALVPGVKHKSAEGRALLVAELKKRISLNRPIK